MKPAIEGGKPIRKEFLVFGKPKITKKEIEEVIDTLNSGWLSKGPKVEKFENLFKEYIKCKFAIALSSCTAGLHLSLDALGIKKQDEVITTPLTFAATVNVIENIGAKPIFVDVKLTDCNIDENKIEEKITNKTKAIIPVHMYGQPAEMDKIMQIAKKYNLYVIEDAAHAIEAEYKDKKIGTISDATCFSFYATKNLTTAEGGMVTTDNEELQNKIRIKSLHGLSKHAWKRYTEEDFTTYEVLYPGYKYNMTDIQASLGIHQLKNIERNLKIREKYWQMYNEAFKEFKYVTIPIEKNNIKHARHLYTILLNLERLRITRNQFAQALQKENIGCGIHFISLHLHSYYRNKYKFKTQDYKNAAYISDRTLSLPLSPYLKKRDVEDVIDAIYKLCEWYKR